MKMLLETALKLSCIKEQIMSLKVYYKSNRRDLKKKRDLIFQIKFTLDLD